MAGAYRVRVAELAGLLGVTPAQILATCKKLGIRVAAAASVLDRSECEIIKRELSSRQAVGARGASPGSIQSVETAAWRQLAQAQLDGKSVRGRVTAVVKGGVTVDVGVRAFIPASQFDVSYVGDLSSYIGATIDARVLEVDPGRNNAILSRRLHVEATHEAARAELLASLQPGQERLATVTSVRPNGLVVDLGGVTSWVPLSAIPAPAGRPLEALYTKGAQITVTVCDVTGDEVVTSLYLAAEAATPAPALHVPPAGLPVSIASRSSVTEGALVVELSEEDCTEAESLIRELTGATNEAGLSELRLLVPVTRRREVRSALSQLGRPDHVGSRRQVQGGFVLGIVPGRAAH